MVLNQSQPIYVIQLTSKTVVVNVAAFTSHPVKSVLAFSFLTFERFCGYKQQSSLQSRAGAILKNYDGANRSSTCITARFTPNGDPPLRGQQVHLLLTPQPLSSQSGALLRLHPTCLSHYQPFPPRKLATSPRRPRVLQCILFPQMGHRPQRRIVHFE